LQEVAPAAMNFSQRIIVIAIVLISFSALTLVHNIFITQQQNSTIEFKKQQHQQPGGTTQTTTQSKEYEPSSIEKYIIENLVNLGYDKESKSTSGCAIWKNESASDIYSDLHEYGKSLDEYNKAVQNFTEIPDLMESIKASGDHQICESAKIHPDGIEAFFAIKHLSRGNSGFMEPLTPPMRSHHYCWRGKNLMRQDYMIHDYEAMCRKLKPTSRRVFIDIGASMKRENNPLVTFLAEYKKFGFHFDHIYAFEIAPFEAKEVYKDILPDEYMASYHWINTGK
jgi:uncharacterized protein YxeA